MASSHCAPIQAAAFSKNSLIHICKDPGKQRQLWEKYLPKNSLFDLWPVRQCFDRQYKHPSEFYILEEDGKTTGMLPLSWIEEERCYGFFPGELWKGKTWLEQNRIVSPGPDVTKALLERVEEPFHLRYLSPECITGLDFVEKKIGCGVDETGYLFFPPKYDYRYDKYQGEFSNRTRKKITKELSLLESYGAVLKLGRFSDVDKLFQMNLGSFKEDSYFYDKRFLKSFIALAEWLKKNGMLVVTTLFIGKRIAAVDIGAVWNSQYTVLAGGNSLEFPGAAKFINFHHIRWACQKKFSLVDFLCGEFAWKDRFHLAPRALYALDTLPRNIPGKSPKLIAMSNRRVSNDGA